MGCERVIETLEEEDRQDEPPDTLNPDGDEEDSTKAVCLPIQVCKCKPVKGPISGPDGSIK